MSPGNVPPHSYNVDQAVHVAIWTGSPLRNKGDISVGELHDRPLNIAWDGAVWTAFSDSVFDDRVHVYFARDGKAPEMT